MRWAAEDRFRGLQFEQLRMAGLVDGKGVGRYKTHEFATQKRTVGLDQMCPVPGYYAFGQGCV